MGGGASALEDPIWTQISPDGTLPGAREVHSVNYDPGTNRLIIYGGGSGPDWTTEYNDVWVLTNADGTEIGIPAWIKLSPIGSLGRADHTAVYDSVNNRLIVFGGKTTNPPAYAATNVVWVLTNANGLGGTQEWIQLDTSGGPPTPREGHSAVYDPVTNRMTIFGGWGGNSDAWVLTNANGVEGTTPTWTKLLPSGDMPTSRGAHTAVYDSSSNRMIIFGGSQASNIPVNDIWALTNANGIGGTPQWIKIEPGNQPPSPRWGHVAVYNPIKNSMVVFGGSNWGNSFSETWFLMNANGVEATTPAWIKLNPGGTLPTPRNQLGAGYSATSNRMVIFGGDITSGCCILQNDLWLLTNVLPDTNPPITTDNSLSTWQNSDFTVTLTCTDNAGGSGCKETKYRIDSGIWQTGASILISEDGDHTIEYYSVDNADNEENHKTTYAKLDKTAPTIDGAATTAPNANGWYNGDVTVRFTCQDGISGPVDSFFDVFFPLEGENLAAIGKCKDNAGNEAAKTVSGINIDKTAPTITGIRTPAPNANGWNSGDVTVHFDCTDGLSTVESCTPDTVVSTEGAGQSVAGTVTDKAGNSATTTVSGISIDKTNPVITISGVTDGSYYNSAVTPVITITDTNLDTQSITLNGAPYTSSTAIPAEGSYTLVASAVDKAGNSASQTVSFVIDKTSPEAMIKFDATSKDIKVYESETGIETGYIVLPSKKEKEDDGEQDDDNEINNKNEKDNDDEKGWELRQYTLKDHAANSLVLVLKHKNEGKEAQVKLVSTQYNGGAVIDAVKNTIQAQYSEEKSGAIKELEQKLKVEKLFDAQAKYSLKKGKSEIKVKLEGQKEKKETRAGIVILELLTDKGGLKLRY